MRKTWKTTAAGVLAIIGGSLNLLVALGIALLVPVATPFGFALLPVSLALVLFLAPGIVAVIGGIFALQRRHWGLSLAGAICALIPPATLLGIVSTVFVALAREEFESSPSDTKKSVPELSEPPIPPSGTQSASCDSSVSQPSEGERNA